MHRYWINHINYSGGGGLNEELFKEKHNSNNYTFNGNSNAIGSFC